MFRLSRRPDGTRGMRASTIDALREYYADLFGIDQDTAWRGVTVEPHVGRLHGFEGFYVAWRDHGVHVSTPAEAEPDVMRAVDGA